MQDDIVTRLARELHIELAAVEAARISQAHAADPSPEDLALRAEAIFLRYGPSREEADAAFQLCEQALALNWREMAYSDHPAYLAFRARLYEGLRQAGMPEQ